MPWNCPACGRADVADDVACPCGNKKTVWTVAEGEMRSLVVTRSRDRFELLAGEGDEPGAATAPEQVAPPARPAEAAWSLPRAAALGLQRRGLRPAPAHQLTARLHLRPGAERSARVTVHFKAREPLEQVLAAPEAGEVVDLRLAFVHGAGDPVSFDGLHVIDVSDDGGPASSVSVAAAKKKARELPLRAVAPAATHGHLRGRITYRYDLRGHGVEGLRDPLERDYGVRNLEVEVVEAPPGERDLLPRRTERDGLFDFGLVPAGTYTVTLTGSGASLRGQVRVPEDTDDDEQGAWIGFNAIPPTRRAMNLFQAEDIVRAVNAALRSVNKVDVEMLDKLMDGTYWRYAKAKLWRSREVVGDEAAAAEVDQPPAAVEAPGANYTFIHQVARIAREERTGNCGEKAAMAAILAAERGCHPTEQFKLLRADHSFAVIGRDPASRCDEPLTWGPDCVICDPWAEEFYPASEINAHLQRFRARHEGLPWPPVALVASVRL